MSDDGDRDRQHFSWLHIPWRPILALPLFAAGLLLLVVIVVLVNRPSGVSSNAPPTRIEDEEASLVSNQNVFLACSDCHSDLDASLKQDPNLTFRHGQHFQTGVSDCATCHPANTHEPDKTNKPTMTTCYMCHGREVDARAPGTCTTCHPSSFRNAPASHGNPEWVPEAHAAAARASVSFDCLTCHNQSTCQSCHGLEIPHPQPWQGTPHVESYFADPTVCARCHEVPATTAEALQVKGRDDCDSCHHPQGPEQTPWVGYHPTLVASKGASTCFQCHATETCATCHRTGQLDLSADEAKFVQAGGA